jgi:menaquinone-dependent protoporphyrinogen IX oxidase
VNVLVTAASQQGATYGIAEAIGRTLRTRGLDARVASADEVLDADGYDAFVIGSAIYTGHWLDQRLRRLSLVIVGIEGDWRDWRAIERWAEEIADALTGRHVEAAGARSGGTTC